MTFWIIILFLLFLFAILPKEYTKYVYWVCIIFLVIVAGFRADSVGNDTVNYSNIFKHTYEYGNSYTEPGWNLLAKFVSLFTEDYHYFFLFISAFTLIVATWVWNKTSVNKQLSLFIYFAVYAYCASLNIMRQYTAISILLIAYKFLIEDRKIICLLFILLASTIHSSALFTLPVIFVNKIKIDKEYFVIFIIIASLIFGSLPIVQNLDFLSLKYENYFANEAKLYRDNRDILFLLCCVYSILFLYIYSKSDKDLRKSPILKVYFIGVVINNVLFQLDLGTRVALNYTIIQTILLPQFFNKQYSYTKWILSSYLLGYCIIMLLRNSATVYPYETVINNYLAFF